MATGTMKLETEYGLTTAYVAAPDGEAPKNAVILIQEWWGINDHIRDIAGRYASEGYLAVAPDLYRGKLAVDSTEASRMMQELKLEDGMATIRQAIADIKKNAGIEKVAITGFCMGGTFALRSACEIETLSAAAPFYGDIPGENILSKLKVPTLFIAAKLDGWITPQKAQGLIDSARKFNLPVEVVSYDADHAFFNNTRPEVYDSDSASDAWKRVLDFFRKNLA